MSPLAYLKAIASFGLRAACITNHGDMGDFETMSAGAPPGVVIIPGVEISSESGDFIVFSTDLDFLGSLDAVQELPVPGGRPPETAVVWAHPFAGSAGGRGPNDEYVKQVADRVDGIEVFNGNWPDAEASRRAREIAGRYDLAELGGSDAHRRELLYRCWTEVGEIDGPAALISAIRDRATRAVSGVACL